MPHCKLSSLRPLNGGGLAAAAPVPLQEGCPHEELCEHPSIAVFLTDSGRGAARCFTFTSGSASKHMGRPMPFKLQSDILLLFSITCHSPPRELLQKRTLRSLGR
ncbi:hypothetical protein P7K49_027965 [Saguinus oedipus]|uniref:Uncharacterized protein n=1 Tax=Saguinus oedipus TaxID=9490 RepID=A0ABQ9UAY2_SAGOE|nr:hypothetical protein P7K49_027965 [Saguinus oedipus]